MHFAEPFRVETEFAFSPFDARGTAHPQHASFAEQAQAAGVGALSVKMLQSSPSHKLGCKQGIDMLGIGEYSTEEYTYGSSMNLPIVGTKQHNTCGCLSVPPNFTGPKKFRHAYSPCVEAKETCPALDPTKACTYGAPSWQPQAGCSYGFSRDRVSFLAPNQGNRFAQYRWG